MIIKFVNGFKIRNTIDTNFGGHVTSDYASYVPKNEIWLEDYLKPEKELFLNLVKEEKIFFRQKKPFWRLRTRLMREAQRLGPCPSFVVKTKHKENLTIRYVDGRLVRKHIDPYFIFGGNDLVYSYISTKEIWIDMRNYEQDQPFALIHELYERKLMARKMGYDDAHDFALAEERYWRRKKGVAQFING